MKKILNSKLFTFILGLVIATTISVFAITSSEVTYRDTDVKSALDTLYDKAHNTLINNIDFSHNKDIEFGTWATSRTVSIDVTKGDYIIILDATDAYTSDSKSNTVNTNITQSNDLTYTNGTCDVIDGDQVSIGSNTGYGSANTYVTSYNKMVVYKCSFTANDTVSYTHTRPTAYSHVVETYKLRYIKLD